MTARGEETAVTIEPDNDAAQRDGAADLGRLATLLDRWESEPWSKVADAARVAGSAMKEHLMQQGVWETLPAADRAAMHWAMATGHRLASIPECHLDPDNEGPHLTHLSHTVRYTADLGDKWTHGARARQARYAEEIGRRMAALPDGWRGEAIRRVMAGEADVPTAFAQASMSLNILGTVFGIDDRQP